MLNQEERLASEQVNLEIYRNLYGEFWRPFYDIASCTLVAKSGVTHRMHDTYALFNITRLFPTPFSLKLEPDREELTIPGSLILVGGPTLFSCPDIQRYMKKIYPFRRFHFEGKDAFTSAYGKAVYARMPKKKAQEKARNQIWVDYGIVFRCKLENTPNWLLQIAGLGTLGTWGAAQAITQRVWLEEIEARLQNAPIDPSVFVEQECDSMAALKKGAAIEILIKTCVDAKRHPIFHPEALKLEYVAMVVNAGLDTELSSPLPKIKKVGDSFELNGLRVPLGVESRAHAIFAYLVEECKAGNWRTKSEIEADIKKQHNLKRVTDVSARLGDIRKALNQMPFGEILCSKKRDREDEYKLNAIVL